MTNGSFMKVESIAECSLWSILQYFWPALSDDRSWKPIFGLFLKVAILERFYCNSKFPYLKVYYLKVLDCLVVS